MRHNRFALLPGLILCFGLNHGDLRAQALYPKPVKVLGDPHFTGTASSPNTFDSTGPNVIEGRELSQPLGIAVDTSVSPPMVYISDTANNRVLGYRYPAQLTPGTPADVILGQPDQYSNTAKGPGTGLTTGLRFPTGLVVDSNGNLYVADTGNNRVLRYPTPLSQSQSPGYQFPDLIIGQSSFSGSSGGLSATALVLSGNAFFSHTGLAIDVSGNLWVTDTGNNRVVRYPAGSLNAYQNGPAADIAVGQANLTANTSTVSRTSKAAMLNPLSIAFDSAGRLLVADSLSRVLVYAAPPTTNTPAIRILGVDVPTFSNPAPAAVSGRNLTSATGVAANASNVIVADDSGHRVLIFGTVDAWPDETTQFSPLALGVLGQTNYTSSTSNQGGQPSSGTLASPVDLALTSTELFVADSANNRVLAYPYTAAGTGPAATRVIGQLDFVYNAPNLVEGKEFNMNGSVSGGVSGAAVLDTSSSPPHLYVADTLNHRVLGFSDFRHLTTGQQADLVIGQPDFFHTVVNYPSGVGARPSAQGLNHPSALAVDSAGNIYVVDSFNSRVLRFPSPFASGQTALESADLVLGQQDFNSIVPDATQRTLSAPVSLAFTKAGADTSQPNSGYLLVLDTNQNRALVFAKPFSNGMNASKVIGQGLFFVSPALSDSTHFSNPRGLAVDPLDRVLVADTGNGRIQVFDAVQNLPVLAPSATFSITSGLGSPYSIGMAPNGQFWVTDPTANRLLHFPGIDQLPLNNYSSDATQTAISPRSAFVDSFNNLLITDGISRVLYFAPGLAAVNAANFISGRALAPGTFAAVFPSIATNILSIGKESAASFPLPTTLSDTQVVVNNTPSPLLFVSPGQINLPLSMSLPTGGTVDLQVVRQSTGQIYGTGEISLSTASPGLFTTNSGSGQVAAINVADGTINSSKTPVLRGQYVTIFGTGQGVVPNAPTDGQTASGPVPTTNHPQILLGPPALGALVPDANIQYSGLAPSLAGVWQINFQIPTTAPIGNSVPLKVIMNSIPSDNTAVPSQIAVTIAIK